MKCNKKCMCSQNICYATRNVCVVMFIKCNKKCMCSQNICLSNEMQQEMYV